MNHSWLPLLFAITAPLTAQDIKLLYATPIGSATEAMVVTAGAQTFGALPQLWTSDDDALDVQAALGVVRVQLDSTAPARGPYRVALQLEVEPSGGGVGPRLTVSFFDVTTGTYGVVLTEDLALGVVATSRASTLGDPARFIDPLTRRVRARAELRWTGASGQPAASFDLASWLTHVPSQLQTIDLSAVPAPSLNTGANWIRTVFPLGPDRMLGHPSGLQLMFDVAGPGPFDYTFRSELREANNQTYPPDGTSQVYRARFELDELPDLYGPMTIFQRFSTANNGPDIEVELTGANQFSNAVPNDLQVVAFGLRERTGFFLKQKNDLAIAIYNAQDGKYKVSLNGDTLYEATGVDTRAASAGSWTQFGLYPHGLHDPANRADQLNSGQSRVSFIYSSYSKLDLQGAVNLGEVFTVDPN